MVRHREPHSLFKVGDKVRVKYGVTDVDYPDMPLSGWAGTIVNVHQDGICQVQWSQETLDHIHPVVKKRCEKDGLALEDYGLPEDDLEADSGGPLRIEQPKAIRIQPLSPEDEDDRIRMVFGLTSNDPLPQVRPETLLTYRKYLAANLAFPFESMHEYEHGKLQEVMVIGLGNPGEPMIDATDGILCQVEIGGQIIPVPMAELAVAKGKANRRLIKDYCSWFWNFR
jgi:hypothetical protein